MMFRGRGGLLVVAPVAVLALVGAALGASSATGVHVTTNTSLQTKIIVNSTGFTLYHLTTEKKGSIACSSSCRKVWLPLLVSGSAKPVAGTGVSASKLGTIKRSDGGVQVTYGGYALYLYSADKKAGQVNGQGIDRTWYAVTPAGTVTKAAVKTSAGTSGGSSGSSAGTTTTGTQTTTTPAAPAGGTTGTPTDNADGCAVGQGIPQNNGGDADNDNIGGETDGDGCL